MASQIRFDPPNVDGLVAAGTTLAAAAERLGVPIALSCGGKGECTSCAVEVLSNPFSLSEVTAAEQTLLGPERIAASIRLGCQASVREGDCVVRVVGHAEEPSTDQARPEESCGTAGFEDVRSRILDAFASLPTSEQVATALDLQVKVAGEFLDTLAKEPLKAGEQFLNSIFGEPPKRDEGGETSDKTSEPHE
ncbi:MAG TPA: 2Fe-2S iron-sulfur cluster-binding protein [Blastocatellia bacterium]|nr:2Fe-2S iron-sulfur cluster-binding protein [Blastocatellia bacterium]